MPLTTKFLLVVSLLLTEEDTYWLGKMLQGENPALHEETSRLLVSTVYNRMELGWCSSVKECVIGGYWGHKNIDVPEKEVFQTPKVTIEPDIIYAMSARDCFSLGIDTTKGLYSGQLFFFSEDTMLAATSGKSLANLAAARAKRELQKRMACSARGRERQIIGPYLCP